MTGHMSLSYPPSRCYKPCGDISPMLISSPFNVEPYRFTSFHFNAHTFNPESPGGSSLKPDIFLTFNYNSQPLFGVSQLNMNARRS